MLQGRPIISALCKYWRRHRELSQLSLALGAEVSSRHISVLEMGRSKPGEEMLLLLASELDIPLRAQNELLRSTSFAAAFEEPPLDPLGDQVIA